MIYVLCQIEFSTGLGPKFIQTGFFVVKNVGISFLSIVIMPMAVPESQNYKSQVNVVN